MNNLTNVYCTYTGGGFYLITANFDDVHLVSDIFDYGTYDVPYDDIEEKYGCDYEAHWKDPSSPLPTWKELLAAVRESYEAGISTNMDMNEVDKSFHDLHIMNAPLNTPSWEANRYYNPDGDGQEED